MAGVRVVAAAVGLSLLAGCSVGGDDDEVAQTLTVFAAASLASAFTEIAEDVEQDDPGVDVRLSFDGSSGLVDQIAGGAPADVLASADTTTMDRAVTEGLVAGEPAVFATNALTLITPPGNPAGITGLDRSLAGTRLVMCAEPVPCGTAARTLARAAGVELRPVSEESGVTDVRGKVASGEADAGIVYVTDAIAAGDRVEQVRIAGAPADPNRYPVAVLAGADDPALAQRFVDAVTGAEGRAVLARHGFGPRLPDPPLQGSRFSDPPSPGSRLSDPPLSGTP
ncbi:molybdate ABC transporter substrate-binding protein [Rhodococcus sp. IEGM 1408]|uniref:molybdate ABC transporter substrate-binding protein n=1 Tax=Rhodococcus sp. IEGM 1408 TaxID=3082220 RepID=UPI002954F5DA|nr:molybdate ABC transporter substrate-binding protein [Rhodococcus sp. IEGM 1408]MDV8001317.1 molybdate ABC transporter substrate-binding protein [Rhodococcus sp. IEGM 1408]